MMLLAILLRDQLIYPWSGNSQRLRARPYTNDHEFERMEMLVDWNLIDFHNSK